MNDVKYRVWFKPDQKMFDVSCLIRTSNPRELRVFPKTTIALEWGVLNRAVESWDIELMQSTGVYDINGVEIYRWDVIISQWNIREVRYDEYMASFVGVRGKEIQSKDDWVSLEFESEIIGNIYENPDLVN